MKKLGVLLIIIILTSMIGFGCSRASNLSSDDTSSKPSTELKEGNDSTEKIVDENLDKYFEGFDGCFVLFDQKKNEYSIYNKEKSEKQISPCSTFKIVNSLIGLETNVLQDENTTFKWDGTKYPIDTWNKDQTLQSAVSNSVVWYFQEVASKVGEEKMKSYLDKLNYGNKDISGGITKFWLQSSLKISPKEQVDMLRELYNNKLPFSDKNINVVKKVLILSNQDGVIFSGKTGSGTFDKKGINGWFVGYVERDNNVFFFATNIEGKDNASGAKAQQITTQILKDKNILS
ncbi:MULTISPECIES: class D beta-lactamase [unclassified Clostridium]|uniref:class D beta-lactamase n=1 Tax=unclassified Clostridium TaxID=2614128 RepID=UPI0002983B60|nr:MULTISPECIES: class D beta-lactamase [unclassified Clostridium]EKQ57702.1 MAG: beta-lactamase class D [Clostridium sp. Maddingley MBC34-26]